MVQSLRLPVVTSPLRVWVRSLSRELRSHKRWGMAKKEKRERKTREKNLESEKQFKLALGTEPGPFDSNDDLSQNLSNERSMLVKDMMGGGSKVISTLCSGSLCIALALLFSGLSPCPLTL